MLPRLFPFAAVALLAACATTAQHDDADKPIIGPPPQKPWALSAPAASPFTVQAPVDPAELALALSVEDAKGRLASAAAVNDTVQADALMLVLMQQHQALADYRYQHSPPLPVVAVFGTGSFVGDPTNGGNFRAAVRQLNDQVLMQHYTNVLRANTLHVVNGGKHHHN